MPISFKQTSMTFHLYNRELSYIIKILPEGIPVQLYFGAALPDRDDWDYLLEFAARPMSVHYSLNRTDMSLEHLRLEYPMSLSGDMRNGAADIRQKDHFARHYDASRALWHSQLAAQFGRCIAEGFLLEEIHAEVFADRIMTTLFELRMKQAHPEELHSFCRMILRGAATRRGIEWIDSH